MAQDQNVNFTLTATDSTSAAFQAAKKNLQSLDDAASGVIRTFGLFAGALGAGAGIAGVTELVMKMTESVRDNEDAMTRLETILANVGAQVGVTKDQVEQYAAQWSQMTAFTRSDLINAENELLKFGNIHADIFGEALEAVVNYAAFTKEQLPQAAEELGKAFTDPQAAARLLRSAGAQLSDQEKDLLTHMEAVGDTAGAQQIIIDKLNQTYRDMAVNMDHGLKAAAGNLAKAWDYLLERLKDPHVGNLSQILKDTSDLANTVSIAITGRVPGSAPQGVNGVSGKIRGPDGKPIGGTSGSADQNELYQRQKLDQELAAERIQSEASVVRTLNSLSAQALDEQHSYGLLTDKQYYEARKQLVQTNMDNELEAINEQIAAEQRLAATGNAQQIQTANAALIKLNAQRFAVEQTAAAQLKQLDLEEEQRRQKIDQERLAGLTAFAKASSDFYLDQSKSLDQFQFETSLIGKNQDAVDKLTAAWQLDQAAAAIGLDSQSDEVQALQKRLAEAYDQRSAMEHSWQTGAKEAFNDYASSALDSATEARTFFSDFYKNAEDALVSFVETGKLNFHDFAQSVIDDLIRIQVQQTIMKPLANWINGEISGGLGDLVSGLLGGGAGNGNTSTAFSNAFAAGPKFGGGMATGGPVSAGTSYLVGENGPELFTPGAAGTITPNGKLGGLTINHNITVNGGGNSDPRALAVMIASISREQTLQILVQQKRAGGVLAAA